MYNEQCVVVLILLLLALLILCLSLLREDLFEAIPSSLLSLLSFQLPFDLLQRVFLLIGALHHLLISQHAHEISTHL